VILGTYKGRDKGERDKLQQQDDPNKVQEKTMNDELDSARSLDRFAITLVGFPLFAWILIFIPSMIIKLLEFLEQVEYFSCC
jgi:hypothetical protein